MVEVEVRVTPKSSRTKVEFGENIKVWVTEPPVDGQANDAVRKALAKALKVPPSAVELIRGHTSRTKAFRIAGLDEAQLTALQAQPKLM